MTPRNLTLVGSAVVFVVGLIAGFQMLLAKPPEPTVAATCEARTVKAGDKLTSNLITVNVFNASKKSGLANRVNINLQRNGFLGGEIGNSNSGAKPAPVTILTNDPNDPRVELVAAQFMNNVDYSVPDIAVKEGVVIVIGDGFTKLKGKPVRSIVASTDVTTCVPIVALP
ncbi:hypothetical protein J2X11_000119 [Aeromicrobium panaciterrae]|uniref:LytR/CpsA/Psr regulator C-terminal domain-containing protein n=1 Tax=Aeromicrobium panaciterrae TaxID=363861 RepID=A0ABU1UJG1_9ACTN|nr:LytR C-terminal domain-containing protein [Aeromicrobium panaciterrae]MDR7085280.1 hypothetical protein [Aeromicrobium panaciterrae]